MALDMGELAAKMFGAASNVLTGEAPEVLEYAKGEMEKIARRIVEIGVMPIDENTPALALNLLKQQKLSSEQLLITVQGLSKQVAQDAINAALGVVSSTVNSALGFALLA